MREVGGRGSNSFQSSAARSKDAGGPDANRTSAPKDDYSEDDEDEDSDAESNKDRSYLVDESSIVVEQPSKKQKHNRSKKQHRR